MEGYSMPEEIQTKELIFKGKKYIIKELTFEEAFDETPLEEKFAKTRAQISADYLAKCLAEPKMTPEEIRKLPAILGSRLMELANELNGFNKKDFMESVEETDTKSGN
jgi:hypothetical protein